ncbi:MAG: 4'-phosphopantetheinyl transferase family protein [Geminicoccaceae bacterium]
MTSDLVAVLAAGSEVHLWLRRLALDAEPSANERASLDADERERAGHFLRDIDRRRFIRRHLHLREVLARYLHVASDGVPLETKLHRPPRLLGDHEANDLRFSLSSSGDRSAVALAWRRPIGVDIERIDPEAANDTVARTVFSLREREAMTATPDGEWQTLFFRIWARKEAFVKAQGTGLARDLMSFDVVQPDRRRRGGGEALVTDRQAEAGEPPWLVRDVHGPPDFALACCAKGDDWSIVCHEDEA